jgi:flavin reductase (DIM6/NTAB) family NADH-FMN oxidoreductase RutF
MKTGVQPNIFSRLAGPQITIVATVKHPDNPDQNAAITLAWTSPLSMKPPLFGIFVGPTRYSHDIISKAKFFTINILPLDFLDKTEWIGRNSGRKHPQKIQAAGFTPVDGKISPYAISIAESIANFECEVVDEVTTGDHTLFVGMVVNATAEEDLLNDDKSGWNFDKVNLIYHAGRDIFVTNKEGICSN